MPVSCIAEKDQKRRRAADHAGFDQTAESAARRFVIVFVRVGEPLLELIECFAGSEASANTVRKRREFFGNPLTESRDFPVRRIGGILFALIRFRLGIGRMAREGGQQTAEPSLPRRLFLVEFFVGHTILFRIDFLIFVFEFGVVRFPPVPRSEF